MESIIIQKRAAKQILMQKKKKNLSGHIKNLSEPFLKVNRNTCTFLLAKKKTKFILLENGSQREMADVYKPAQDQI